MRHCYCHFLFLVVLFFRASVVYANIPAQYYQLFSVHEKVFDSPNSIRDQQLPEVIHSRIGKRKFSKLPGALQRALLWEAGLLPSAGGKNLHQVYVQCGYTMNDVFLTRGYAFGDSSSRKRCYYEVCNALNMVFASKENCSVNEIVPFTRCGVLENKDIALTSMNPMWSEGRSLDQQSNIGLTKYTDQSLSPNASHKETLLYLIEEKPQMKLSKTNCPSKASFITPCRRLKKEEISSDTVSQWCRPEKDVIVDMWLDEIDLEHQLFEAKTSTQLNLLSIVLLIISIFACSIIVYLLYRLRLGHQRNTIKDSLGSTLYCARNDDHTLRQYMANTVSQNVAMLESDRNSVDPAHRLSGWLGASHINARNAFYLNHSEKLREFFEDSQLIMKRITYSSLNMNECIASDKDCELWRAEYDGIYVAVKRAFRAERIKELDADLSKPVVSSKIMSSNKELRGSTATINSGRFSKLDEYELKRLEQFTMDIRLASSLEHPCIVRFIGLSWRSLHELCMVSEYMVHGELAHVLRASRRSTNLSWTSGKLSIASNVANALVYLHSMAPPVFHRRLISRNILLNERYDAKLYNISYRNTKTMEHSTFIAPEVLNGEAYTDKADVFSFGLLLSELDTCKAPQSNKSISAEERPSMLPDSLEFKEDCPAAIKQLAHTCLAFDPRERPNAMQISFFLRSKVLPTL